MNAGDAGSTAASITSNGGPWNLADGDVITFSIDGGANIDATFSHTPASVTGGAGPYDLSTDNTIGFTVNGVTADNYTFLVGDVQSGDLANVTADDAADVINREYAGISASVESGNLTVRTDRGDASATLVVTGSAATPLGLGAAIPGSGNVSDINNVTAAEAMAVINAAIGASGVSVTQVGNTVVITHDTAGLGNTIQIQPGGVEATLGFDTVVHDGSDAVGASGAIAAEVTLQALSVDALTVTAAYRGESDAGDWGNDLEIAVIADEDDATRFELQVKYTNAVVETWSNLSMDSADADDRFVEDVVNDEFSGSKFVMVDASGANRPDETRLSGEIFFEPLVGGDDGSFAAPADEINAYAAAVDLYDLVDIQLLCCPETEDAALVSKALTHCQSKGDRMFAGHTPEAMGAADIRDAYSRNFQGDKVYGALYFPWIQINDPIGKRKWIPPIGHILGVYARTERERGIWKAPAGNAAKLNGALDVQFHINDIDHTSLVKRAAVNSVRFMPGQGIIIDSSRTLSTNTLWLYVNVRLLFNYVKSSLVTGLRWVVQEPHNEDLWNKVKFNSVTPFLMGLWRRGAFGPGAPSDVFTVKVDAENNPPANIQQGIFTTEIYFYPSRPAETVVIVVGQQEGAGSANEG